MKYSRSLLLSVAVVAVIASVEPSAAAVYDVPTAAWPTLKSALDDAAANGQPVNVIQLVTTPIEILDPIEITYAFPLGFHAGRTLVIRPKPGVAVLRRVSIVSLRPQDPVLRIVNQQNITLEDIDLLRNITNDGDLMDVVNGTDITFDRCRIGLIWPSYISPGRKMVDLIYPKRVLFRNCMTFSVMRDAFAIGISATGFIDPENSVYIYNSLIADYRDHGFYARGSMPGQVIALRNNVFINDPDYPVVSEPTAVESHVTADVTVLSSHNTVYTDALRIEDQFGAQPLLRVTTDDFLRLFRPDAAASFWTMDWVQGAIWDPNPDFYRLIATGPLHFPDSRHGITVTAAAMPSDYPVAYDIERDLRPGGTTLHTDRGPDQIEPGQATASVDAAPWSGRLVMAVRSPGPDPSLVFSAPVAGELSLEVLDVTGRAVHRESRRVRAGDRGTLGFSHARPGMYFYRARLVSADSAMIAGGKCVVVR